LAAEARIRLVPKAALLVLGVDEHVDPHDGAQPAAGSLGLARRTSRLADQGLDAAS